MSKKREQIGFNKEISNNILVLILIVIIFVSLLGTMIVKDAIDAAKSTPKIIAQSQKISANSGMISLEILPQEKGEKNERSLE